MNQSILTKSWIGYINQREQLKASLMIQNMNSVPDWESHRVKINDSIHLLAKSPYQCLVLGEKPQNIIKDLIYGAHDMLDGE